MATRPPDSPEHRPPPEAQEHVVIFRLAEEHYALDIQGVQEIVRMQAITPIPGSEPWVEGITNLRGRVVPVIDLGRRFAVTAEPRTSETRIIVVNSSSGLVGLIVDAVSEVLRIPGDQVEPPGAIVSASGATCLRGIATLDDKLVSLIDLDRLIPAEEASAAEPATIVDSAAA
jgi:purine-binding chemotaxis protein CheW